MNVLKIVFFGTAAFAPFLGRCELLSDGGFDSAPLGFRLEGFTQCGSLGASASVASSFSGGNSRAVWDKGDFSGGEAELYLAFEKPGGSAGLLLGVSGCGADFEDFKGCELSFDSGFSTVSVIEYPGCGEKPKTVLSMPVDAPGGKWRRIHAVSEPDGFYAYLDDREVLALKGLSPSRSGKAGFVSRGADARFRDFRLPKNGRGKPALLYGRETPSVCASWEVLASSKNAAFYHDDERGMEGNTSQEISARDGVAGISNSGVKGAGISARRGETLKGSLGARSKGLDGRLFVRLLSADSSKVYAQAELKKPGPKWSVETFELTPSEDVSGARFAIVLEGSGSAVVDSASLSR